jgi:hypothetical protein
MSVLQKGTEGSNPSVSASFAEGKTAASSSLTPQRGSDGTVQLRRRLVGLADLVGREVAPALSAGCLSLATW